MPNGGFVLTSNVDGQFQKAGFDPARIVEIHGSIHALQCLRPCSGDTWDAASFVPDVDAAACRLIGEPPRCPRCGGLARPNILMFGDWGWHERRTAAQGRRLRGWLNKVERLVVIELGAGTNVPTVRIMSESLGGPLIRINPTEPGLGGADGVSVAKGALEALRAIETALEDVWR